MKNNINNEENLNDDYLKNLLPKDDFLNNFLDEHDENCSCVFDVKINDFNKLCDDTIEENEDLFNINNYLQNDKDEACDNFEIDDKCNIHDECCNHNHNDFLNEDKSDYKNIDDMDVKEEIDKLVSKLSNVEIDEDIIIVVANSYISKYYINPKIEKNLPKEVKNDLKALLVTITEKNGGIIEVHYVDKEMEIYLKTYSSEEDFLYDEIGAKSDLSKIEIQYREMFEQIAAVSKISLRDIFK